MDHKREHRTPPLARVMGVGRQQHMCLARVEMGVRGLSLGFTNIVGAGECWTCVLCLDCGGVSGVHVE